jgi:hypothetical protein
MRYNYARNLLEELDPRNPLLSALDTSKSFPQSWDVYRLNQEIAKMNEWANLQKKGLVDRYDFETMQKLKGLDVHHPFPRDSFDEFRAAGIEPNDYIMPMGAGHHRLLHTGPNRWEKLWTDYLDQAHDPSPADLIEQLNKMNKRYFWMRR